MVKRKIEDYADIINLPHHVSESRQHMTMIERAAQFSPFAALTGYGDEVKEAERVTGERIELSEYEQQRISERLAFLKSHLEEAPEIEVTYFVTDERKTGGKYVTVTGSVSKIEELKRILIMSNGTKIPFEEIIDVNGNILNH